MSIGLDNQVYGMSSANGRHLDRLDIVIPVYNEGENIVDVLESLRKSVKTPFRIFICYDHDQDTTLKALSGYANVSTVEIVTTKNQGVGVLGAVQTGFRATSSEAVLIFPADDTFNAGIVDAMVAKYESGCEIVCASRFVPGGCMKGCPWLKAVLVRSAAFLLYHVARLPAHDQTSGFRLFSRRVIDEFPIESPRSWSFSLELLVKSHRRGYLIGEVPALWFERTKGQSRFKVLAWLPLYLRWFFYAFATTFLGRKACSMRNS